MFVIIKSIEKQINANDLESFIEPAIKGRFYQKKGNIKALKIIQLVDRNGNPVERHGLVIGCSDYIIKRMIKTLNGHILGYEQAKVAEYMIRYWRNDRRSDLLTPSSFPNDKRLADRRRLGLRIVT